MKAAAIITAIACLLASEGRADTPTLEVTQPQSFAALRPIVVKHEEGQQVQVQLVLNAQLVDLNEGSIYRDKKQTIIVGSPGLYLVTVGMTPQLMQLTIADLDRRERSAGPPPAVPEVDPRQVWFFSGDPCPACKDWEVDVLNRLTKKGVRVYKIPKDEHDKPQFPTFTLKNASGEVTERKGYLRGSDCDTTADAMLEFLNQ